MYFISPKPIGLSNLNIIAQIETANIYDIDITYDLDK